MSGKDNVSSNLVLPCGISLAPNSRLGVSFFHLLEHVLQGLHIVMEAKKANHGRSISSLVKALLNEKAGFDLLQQKTKAATANLDNVPKDVSEAWDSDFHFKTVGSDYRYEFFAGASMRWDLSLDAPDPRIRKPLSLECP